MRVTVDELVKEMAKRGLNAESIEASLSTDRHRAECLLEEALEAIRESGVIAIRGPPYAAYLVGRIVNEGKVAAGHDIDLLLRQKPDVRAIAALKSSLPEWLSSRLHIFFDIAGPGIGLSVPVYSYAFNPLPRECMIRGFGPFSLEELQPGKQIVGVKPKAGVLKNEFFKIEDLWKYWGALHIGNGVVVEEKVDGRRFMLHILANNDVKLFTEDTHRDRAAVFGELVDEIKSLHWEDSIIDGEMLVWMLPENVEAKNAEAKRRLGELMPREDTAVLTAGKQIPEHIMRGLTFVVYDILRFKGKDVYNQPYIKRRQLYTSIIPKDSRFIIPVRGELATNMREFISLVKKYRAVNGSEGVVCKDASFQYPIKYKGENRSDSLAKLKNVKEIDVLVLGVKAKREAATGREIPNYMYDCYIALPKDRVHEFDPSCIREYNGKLYLRIGWSYATKTKAKIGDIITVMPIRIRFYTRDSKKYVTWMFPIFKEVKADKSEPDSVTVAERIAEAGTGPLELEATVRISLRKCPYYAEAEVCPLLKRYGVKRAIYNLALVEVEVLKYPVMCPIAAFYKCPYLKKYYYGYVGMKYYPELSEIDVGAIDSFKLPEWLFHKLQGKYMEMPKGEHDFVIQAHILTKEYIEGDKHIPKTGSQHLDFRISVDGYLIGWSIVGGSVDKFITPRTLLEKRAKGFRAEEKAHQPKVWLFKDKPAAEAESFKPGDIVPEMFDVIVGAGEPRGKMIVLTRGKAIFGWQEPYFHEYFLKDNRYFKDWTRIVVRRIKARKLDPETKQPTGKHELFWRIMVPEDQTPYIISDRAMEAGKLPSKDNPFPFPREWAEKHFPEQYRKWLEYVKAHGVELSAVKYALVMHSYRGPIHVRGMYIRDYYLLLDDKGAGKVRAFKLGSIPPFATVIDAYDWGRVDRKYLEYTGETEPGSVFNPTKATIGKITVIDSGVADYNTSKADGREILKLNFKGEVLRGSWVLMQEERLSDVYVFRKAEELGFTTEFVYHEHIINGKPHYDLRLMVNGVLVEWNIPVDLAGLEINSSVEAVYKKCYDVGKWFIKEGTGLKLKVGSLDTIVNVLDSGGVIVYEYNPDFISMKLEGKLLNGFYIAKKLNHKWTIIREKLPTALSTGDPLRGDPFDPFKIVTKSTWSYFRVYIYDPREFTRTEPTSKAKLYLPDLDIPKGVKVYIGLYPVSGQIHNARVAMVEFSKDLWDTSKAIKWIMDNKLHLWHGKMIRGG